MTVGVVFLVLAAAMMHAIWSSFAKAGGAPESTIAGFLLVRTAICLPFIPWTPAPTRESWPLLAASLSVHTAYYLTMSRAYRVGDISLVYPIFRGLAPVLVAVAGFGLAGERLSGLEWLGMGVICTSIISLAVRRAPGRLLQHAAAVRWGIVTGLLVAGYTVADGLGVRLAGHEAGYIMWLFVLEFFPLGGWLAATQGRAMVRYLRSQWRGCVAGGLSLTLSYGAVVYAMSRAEMALVSSLRETSVIFAALLGTLVLHEPLGVHRVVVAIAVVGGIVLIQLG